MNTFKKVLYPCTANRINQNNNVLRLSLLTKVRNLKQICKRTNLSLGI